MLAVYSNLIMEEIDALAFFRAYLVNSPFKKLRINKKTIKGFSLKAKKTKFVLKKL